MNNDYDPVAARYAAHFRDELSAKPFDTTMLTWLAQRVGDLGPICDMGCGPGQVAAFLQGLGVPVCGIDLSAEMVRWAAELNPDIPFARGDMLDLADVAGESFGGVAAFYAIVNIPPSHLPTTLTELARVLRRGGVLLLSFHIGDETRHLDEMLDTSVDLDFYFYPSQVVAVLLRSAGFVVTEVIERDPYADDVEHQTRRAYIFATKR